MMGVHAMGPRGPKQADTLIKISEAAKRLCISPKTVLKLINEGTLSACDVSGGRNRLRRTLRMKVSEVDRFLGETTTNDPDPEAGPPNKRTR